MINKGWYSITIRTLFFSFINPRVEDNENPTVILCFKIRVFETENKSDQITCCVFNMDYKNKTVVEVSGE